MFVLRRAFGIWILLIGRLLNQDTMKLCLPQTRRDIFEMRLWSFESSSAVRWWVSIHIVISFKYIRGSTRRHRWNHPQSSIVDICKSISIGSVYCPERFYIVWRNSIKYG